MRIFNRKVIIIVYIISAGLFIYSLASFFHWHFNFGHNGNAEIAGTLNSYADDIVAKCANAKYKPTCYEDEIPKLMQKISMEDAFNITRLVQGKDSSYKYCHVLGHKLSAQETAKDPEKWKEVIPRCPSGLCSNGCIHGAFQERFRSETLNESDLDTLKKDLSTICEPRSNWSPTGLEQGTCYHAVGHLLMYVTSADVNKSIQICKEVAVKPDGHDWSKLCFDGIFMQIYQPLENEDKVLVDGKQPKKEAMNSFCSKYTGNERVSCWSESWPIFFDEIMTPQGLVNFCSNGLLKDSQDQNSCYNGMFYVITAEFQFDLAKVRTFCMGLPQTRMDQCFAGAASRLIETDYRNIPVVANFCASITSVTSKDACYQELIKYSTYNFHAGSDQYLQLCNSLPEPYKDECFNSKSVK